MYRYIVAVRTGTGTWSGTYVRITVLPVRTYGTMYYTVPYRYRYLRKVCTGRTYTVHCTGTLRTYYVYRYVYRYVLYTLSPITLFEIQVRTLYRTYNYNLQRTGTGHTGTYVRTAPLPVRKPLTYRYVPVPVLYVCTVRMYGTSQNPQPAEDCIRRKTDAWPLVPL